MSFDIISICTTFLSQVNYSALNLTDSTVFSWVIDYCTRSFVTLRLLHLCSIVLGQARSFITLLLSYYYTKSLSDQTTTAVSKHYTAKWTQETGMIKVNLNSSF